MAQNNRDQNQQGQRREGPGQGQGPGQNRSDNETRQGRGSQDRDSQPNQGGRSNRSAEDADDELLDDEDVSSSDRDANRGSGRNR